MATWLYHRTEAPRVFETAGDVETALADGWADTPAAFTDEPAPDSEQDGNELTVLRTQAEALGIKVDARWGAKRIQKEIDAKA